MSKAPAKRCLSSVLALELCRSSKSHFAAETQLAGLTELRPLAQRPPVAWDALSVTSIYVQWLLTTVCKLEETWVGATVIGVYRSFFRSMRRYRADTYRYKDRGGNRNRLNRQTSL